MCTPNSQSENRWICLLIQLGQLIQLVSGTELQHSRVCRPGRIILFLLKCCFNVSLTAQVAHSISFYCSCYSWTSSSLSSWLGWLHRVTEREVFSSSLQPYWAVPAPLSSWLLTTDVSLISLYSPSSQGSCQGDKYPHVYDSYSEHSRKTDLSDCPKGLS